jgi:hypothetical protein
VRIAFWLVLVLAGGSVAAPPVEVPKEVAGEVGAFVTVRAKTEGKIVRFVPLDAGLNVFPADLLSDKKATVVTASQSGRYRLLAYSSVKDDPTEPAVVTVVIGGAEPAPEPKPKPVDPKPKPVESFRVLLIYESSQVLPAAQFGVLYGKEVEQYLTANCTKDGARNGWRRLDKDAPTDNDTETFGALWAAVKPKVTRVPCVAVEVNGNVTIEPLPASVADALALFKKYRGQ